MARMALTPTDAALFCMDIVTGQTVLTVHDLELGKRLAEKNAAAHAGDAMGPVAGHG